ncbi:MAG: hypothetical protein ACRDWT_12150 [Jatrophihabitantaceae bacterium]
MTTEDQRLAASLRVSISSYVGTASLAVLAGLVAVFTYYQQNFEPMVLFYVFISTATVAIVASIICGGKGAASVAKKVAQSTYDGSTETSEFNYQAILALVCVIAAIAAVVCGGLSGTNPR